MNNILDRIREVITKTGLSDSAFAKTVDTPQATFSNMMQRKSDPKSELLKNIIDKYNVSADWLLTGSGSMFVTGDTPSAGPARIPLLRQTVSCGPGQEWGDADNVEAYIQPVEMIAKVKGQKIYAFRAAGTSMVGAGISDGDILFFDGTPTDDYGDDLYVFAIDGKVFCKFLKFDEISRKIELYSMHSADMEKAELIKTIDSTNPETAKTMRIFGRVLAWMHENRLCRK